MTEETLKTEISRLEKIIKKAQRGARPFNLIIRDARRKQKELNGNYRKQLRDSRQKQKDRQQAERLAAKAQCAYIYELGNYSQQCGNEIIGRKFCARHDPDRPQCKREGGCLNPAKTGSPFCGKHQPGYKEQKHRFLSKINEKRT